MAPSVSLFYILFTVGFLTERPMVSSQLELGIHFLEEPKNTIGLKGKSINIPCRPRATRQRDSFEIIWYHDNKQMDLKNDRRRIIFPNGTLHFSKLVHKRIGHSDQGEYRCVAAGENGSLSSKPGLLRISILANSFSRHPVNQAVGIGSNVKFICEIEYFMDVEIYWEKDNKKIIKDVRKYMTISGFDIPGSILYIFNVGPEDSGNYRCIARNTLSNKERHSSNAVLTVLPKKTQNFDFNTFTFLSAQHTFSTNVREVKEGENVTLDCVTDNLSTLIVGWTYLELGHNTSRSLYNSTSSGYDVMNLKRVTRQQEGWYTCNAMNLIDQTYKKLKTHLKVLFPPEIQEKSESTIFRTSKTVRFRCVAHGNPIPHVYWLKDGSLFNITGRIKHRTSTNESEQLRISELIVASTVAGDAGIYQCMAKNLVGWTWAASRLLLNATKPAPEAPERVSCETISSSQIKLTWDISNSSNKIKAFTIHYHLTDNGEEMQKVISSDSRSIQIDKLTPFSNYTFYLRLYMESASEFSDKAICQTAEEVPIDGPTQAVHFMSQNSVRISWAPLNKGNARGIIKKYRIQWRSTKSPSLNVVEVGGNIFNYTIKGLIPGKKYDVRVLAATSKGFPSFDLPWETFEIPVNLNSNILSPPKVVLKVINSSSIEIRWWLSNNDNGMNINGYKLYYGKQNSNKVGPVIVPADTNKYVVTGLESETWYEFMVLGFTDKEDGEVGVSFVTTDPKSGSENKTDIFIPEPPVSLEADSVSPVAINLTWSASQSLSRFNNIKHYTVCFNPVQGSHNSNITINCVKSSETKISIVGLHPYTLYEFKVRAHDQNDRESLFSPTMECYTLEGVPSPVIDIGWKAVNKSAVQISWKEPRHINGILKNYIISYTDNYNSPIESWNMKFVTPEIHESLLLNLNSNVKYYFIVRASTGAGLGSYASPKQIFIHSKSAVRNKKNDHYLGVMIGLGIGIFCIIICTTCILCRRRCLKRQCLQEIEVTPCGHNNASICQRDRQHSTTSREAEYFSFLSDQSEQPNSLEIGTRQFHKKRTYLNASTNGITMSLLTEQSKITNDGSGKINIYVNETSRLDRNVAESSVFHYKSHCVNGASNYQEPKFKGNYFKDTKTPLLKRKLRDMSMSTPSDNSRFESESCTKIKRTTPVSCVYRNSNHSKSEATHVMLINKQVSRCTAEYEDENLPEELNSILKNPEFRFSNSSSEVLNNKSQPNGNCICNQLTGNGDANGNGILRYNLDFGIYKDSNTLHFLTKEIIQES